jgi:hypothetical protein
MPGGLIGIIWALILVLKIAGLAFVHTSYWLIVLWPLIPIAILIVLGLLGVTFFHSTKRSY